MRDNTLTQSDANVQADAFAGAFNLDGTPAEGVWVQFVITRNSADADETLKINVHGKDTDAGWATTDPKVAGDISIVNADVANGGTIVRYLLVQTKLNYINPHYDVGGTTPDWTVVASIVSGPDQKQTAALS